MSHATDPPVYGLYDPDWQHVVGFGLPLEDRPDHLVGLLCLTPETEKTADFVLEAAVLFLGCRLAVVATDLRQGMYAQLIVETAALRLVQPLLHDKVSTIRQLLLPLREDPPDVRLLVGWDLREQRWLSRLLPEEVAL